MEWEIGDAMRNWTLFRIPNRLYRLYTSSEPVAFLFYNSAIRLLFIIISLVGLLSRASKLTCIQPQRASSLSPITTTWTLIQKSVHHHGLRCIVRNLFLSSRVRLLPLHSAFVFGYGGAWSCQLPSIHVRFRLCHRGKGLSRCVHVHFVIVRPTHF